MVSDVFVDDQRVAVIGNDRSHDRPAEADTAAVELVGAQRYLRAGVRLQRSQRTFRRWHAVLAAANQLGNGQVLEQTVLEGRWRRAHGRLAGRTDLAVIRHPRGEVQKTAIAVQRIV